MSLDVWNYLPKFRKQYDLIVGIPRSGMVAAAMIASYLDCALASLDLFVCGSCMTKGSTRTTDRMQDGLVGVHNVLVVDDSIYHGNAMREAKTRIASSKSLKKYSLRIQYAAVYSRSGKDKDIDFSMAICPLPRVFQWNIFNHPEWTPKSCFDIDGVVCSDPEQNDNDDGERYLSFLRNTSKKLNVRFPIGAFVSSRLEKYRGVTNDWLAKNGYAFGDLLLLDLPDKQSRIEANAHAARKADVYAKRSELLFVESDKRQAFEIAWRTGKDVFCTQTMSLVHLPVDRERNCSIGTLQRIYATNAEQMQKIDELRKGLKLASGGLKAERMQKSELLSKVAELRDGLARAKTGLEKARGEKAILLAKVDELRSSIRGYKAKIENQNELLRRIGIVVR